MFSCLIKYHLKKKHLLKVHEWMDFDGGYFVCIYAWIETAFNAHKTEINGRSLQQKVLLECFFLIFF